MKASVKWVEDWTFIGRSQSGHSIVLGGRPNPEAEGSGAPSPMELVLLALGGCTAIDVVSIMEKKRQPIKGFEINIDSERADDYPRVFSRVELEYVLYGDLDPKAVDDAVQLSMEKYCSVSAMVEAKAKISYRVRVEKELSAK
ncbi:MAG TPA: OsmC family protein [Firmicutes bacterium]|jgi:putative redox protein|nr:OsmC family protein [Bacillota bacterium]HCT37578.1 OsmC family protein [Bacillota bacterium]